MAYMLAKYSLRNIIEIYRNILCIVANSGEPWGAYAFFCVKTKKSGKIRQFVIIFYRAPRATLHHFEPAIDKGEKKVIGIITKRVHINYRKSVIWFTFGSLFEIAR